MDEYVKRAAIMEFPIRKDHCDKERANEHFIFGIESVLEYVENLPSADVAPVVHGVWIPVHESEISGWNPEVAGIDPIDGYICSACKNEAVYDCNDKFVLSDYCPRCGARMDGDSDALD